MPVIHYREAPLFQGGHTTFPVCPRCPNSLEREYQAFCERCGQKLGWEFFRHATRLPAK